MSRWLICLLGAVDGLAFAGTARLIMLYFDYLERTAAQEGNSDATGRIYVNVAPLQEKWLGLTLIIVCLFVLASYAVDRYWRKSRSHIGNWMLSMWIPNISTVTK